VSVKVANKSVHHDYEKGKHKCLFAKFTFIIGKSYAYPFAGVTHHMTHPTFSFATSC
jgi:hypothetical protein